MKERVIHNRYYQNFGDFRNAIFGFLKLVSELDSESNFGCELRSRVRDRFRPIGFAVK